MYVYTNLHFQVTNKNFLKDSTKGFEAKILNLKLVPAHF